MAAPAAPQASNGDLGLAPPATVVIPPKALRETISKTADFIHRKGEGMEDKMRQRSGNDAKFAFLNPQDPYHGYYAWYLQQLRDGKGAALQGQQQQVVDNKPKGPAEPSKFRFSARMPTISAKDLEVLKLTALYTARNGENWLKELRNREAGNFQFDFLRPTHSLFQFFRSLVDQYKILLEETATVEARIAELQLNTQNRFHVLDRAKQRAEYVKYVQAQKEKETKKKEEETREFQSIDWHDFAVIATVTFDEADDAADLPPPTSLGDLQSASLEQKAQFSLSRRIEEAAPDEQTYYNVSQHAGGFPGYAPAAPPAQPVYAPAPMPAPPPQPAPHHTHIPVHPREDDAQKAVTDRARAAATGPAPSTIRLRTDYVPRALSKKSAQAPQLVLCPNCKQQIPANEYDEHVRIELLDPRWKEQRAKADERYSTTINTVDVANNLKRFASQRDDVFDGVTGMPLSEEEVKRRKKAASSYDGVVEPGRDAERVREMQSLNVQEQLRRIQERHGGGK